MFLLLPQPQGLWFRCQQLQLHLLTGLHEQKRKQSSH